MFVGMEKLTWYCFNKKGRLLKVKTGDVCPTVYLAQKFKFLYPEILKSNFVTLCTWIKTVGR